MDGRKGLICQTGLVILRDYSDIKNIFKADNLDIGRFVKRDINWLQFEKDFDVTVRLESLVA